MPGGNPVALQSPETFSIKFMICEDCKGKFCDRCLAKKRRLLHAPRCHKCRGKLFDGELREEIESRPWPDAVTRCNAGIELRQAAKSGEALVAFGEAVRLRPEYVLAHCLRGVTLRELGRHTEALAAFDQAVRLDRRYAQALFDKAGLHRQLAEWEEALRTYEQAISIEPNFVAAHANKAVTLNDLGRHVQALAASETAIRIEEAEQAADDSPDARACAYAAKAVALIKLGHCAEGLAAIDIAISAGPDDPLRYHVRGFALEKLGRYEEAQLAYRIYEEFQPRPRRRHRRPPHRK